MTYAEFITKVNSLVAACEIAVSLVGRTHHLVQNDPELRRSLRDLVDAIDSERVDLLALKRLELSVRLFTSYVWLTWSIEFMCTEMAQANRLAYEQASEVLGFSR